MMSDWHFFDFSWQSMGDSALVVWFSECPI